MYFIILSKEVVALEVFYEGVPKNFEKVTGRYLCRNQFLSKVASLRLATLLKKYSDTRAFY